MKTVRLRTLNESQPIVVKFRIVKGLTQPILSVSKLNESGKEVVLGNGYGYIKKREGGAGPERLELTSVGSLYYLMASWEDQPGTLAPLGEDDVEVPAAENPKVQSSQFSDYS